MTSDDVKQHFETLIDDTWDEDATFLLMQNEEEKLELEREWIALRKTDSSITVDSTTTWQTPFTLPTDFLSRRKVYVDNANTDPYIEIPYDDIQSYQNNLGYYAIDYANKKIYFCGSFSQTYTVYIKYQRSTGDIADGTYVFIWPGRSAATLAYRMAAHHKGGVDGDLINFQMTGEQRQEYKEMKNALIQWDTRLKLKAMGN